MLSAAEILPLLLEGTAHTRLNVRGWAASDKPTTIAASHLCNERLGPTTPPPGLLWVLTASPLTPNAEPRDPCITEMSASFPFPMERSHCRPAPPSSWPFPPPLMQKTQTQPPPHSLLHCHLRFFLQPLLPLRAMKKGREGGILKRSQVFLLILTPTRAPNIILARERRGAHSARGGGKVALSNPEEGCPCLLNSET